MAKHRPLIAPADAPAVVPVFPLAGALLLPRAELPLNIFEPRYLAMIDDVLAGDRMVGMIQPDEAKPEDERGPALFKVGCLGRIHPVRRERRRALSHHPHRHLPLRGG